MVTWYQWMEWWGPQTGIKVPSTIQWLTLNWHSVIWLINNVYVTWTGRRRMAFWQDTPLYGSEWSPGRPSVSAGCWPGRPRTRPVAKRRCKHIQKKNVITCVTQWDCTHACEWSSVETQNVWKSTFMLFGFMQRTNRGLHLKCKWGIMSVISSFFFF